MSDKTLEKDIIHNELSKNTTVLSNLERENVVVILSHSILQLKVLSFNGGRVLEKHF